MSDAINCSKYVLDCFPKPCGQRKAHRCCICGNTIMLEEQCCRWSGVDHGAGYVTSHAHPECFNLTKGWDEMDWENYSPGDLPRPEVRMKWLDYALSDNVNECSCSLCASRRALVAGFV